MTHVRISLGLENGLFVSFELDLFCKLLIVFNGLKFLEEEEFQFSLCVLEANKSVHHLFLLDIQLVYSCESGLQLPTNAEDIIRFELEPGSREVVASFCIVSLFGLEFVLFGIDDGVLKVLDKFLGVVEDN